MSTTTLEPAENTAGLKRRAVRGGALLLAVRLSLQVFQWGITLVVARLLMPEDYGVMMLGMMFVGFCDLLADAGVGRALVYKKQLEREDLAQGFTLSLVIAAVLYAILFAIAPLVAEHLHKPDFALFLRVFALMLFQLPVRSVGGALLERDFKVGTQSAIQIAGTLVHGFFIVLLAWLGFGYWSLALSVMAGRSLETVLLAVGTRCPLRLALPTRAAWELLRYGSFVSMGGMLWFIYNNADSALLSILLGPAALGTYSLAFQLATMPVQKLSGNLNQVLFAVFCRLRDDKARVSDWFIRFVVILCSFALPAMVGLVLIADEALPVLLGEKWHDVVLPFQMLSMVGVLMVIGSSLIQLISAVGRSDVSFYFTATCAAVLPIGFYVAGSAAGMVGICLVWLLLYPILLGGLITLTRQLTGVNVARVVRALVVPTLLTAAMAGVVLAVKLGLPADLHVALRLPAEIAAGALSYGAGVWLFARATIVADLHRLWAELRARPHVETGGSN